MSDKNGSLFEMDTIRGDMATLRCGLGRGECDKKARAKAAFALFLCEDRMKASKFVGSFSD